MGGSPSDGRSEGDSPPPRGRETPAGANPRGAMQTNWLGVSAEMKKSAFQWTIVLAVILLGIAFVFAMSYAFRQSSALRDLFSGASSDAFGEVAANSKESIASRNRTTATVSMYIFSVITALQFVAFGVGAAVVAGIRRGGEAAKVQLRRLENAEIFFDVPLYVGLFGTISAFLVMAFSPQSSRLIAYSSTLIGIVFSLVLRLTLQYPMRQSLISRMSAADEEERP